MGGRREQVSRRKQRGDACLFRTARWYDNTIIFCDQETCVAAVNINWVACPNRPESANRRVESAKLGGLGGSGAIACTQRPRGGEEAGKRCANMSSSERQRWHSTKKRFAAQLTAVKESN